MKNATDRSVTDIHWELAKYFRNLVPSKQEACDTLVVDGSIATPLPVGPLYWGPTRTSSYTTQVYKPQRGWPEATGRTYGDVIPFSAEWGSEPLQLFSGITVFPTADKAASVELKSAVTYAASPAKKYTYTYTIAHDAPGMIHVRWAVVADPTSVIREQFGDFVLSPERAIPVPKDKPVTFRVTSDQPPKSGIGTVIITDREGRELARGQASSFGPKTGTIADK